MEDKENSSDRRIDLVLETAANLLATPERWRQGGWAWTAEGKHIHPCAIGATQWSIIGAISRITREDDIMTNRAMAELSDRLWRAGWRGTVFAWEERADHQSVLALLRNKKELG